MGYGINETPIMTDLVKELDIATAHMMKMSADQVGGHEWRLAFERQQRAFRSWRDYLYRQADEPHPSRLRI